MQDLCAGSCDIAMVSGSVEKAAAGANLDKPGSVDLGGLQTVPAGKDPILFVVNPANPVTALTLQQIKGILTGALSNWKEAGGAEGVIDLFSLGSRNGPRIAVDEQMLGGAAVAATAVQRETPKDICPIVAQKPNGFGCFGRSNLGPGVKVLKTDKEVAMPIFLAASPAGTPDPAPVFRGKASGMVSGRNRPFKLASN